MSGGYRPPMPRPTPPGVAWAAFLLYVDPLLAAAAGALFGPWAVVAALVWLVALTAAVYNAQPRGGRYDG